jgi:hypothetical protein
MPIPAEEEQINRKNFNLPKRQKYAPDHGPIVIAPNIKWNKASCFKVQTGSKINCPALDSSK